MRRSTWPGRTSGTADRAVRHAARLAVERQPVGSTGGAGRWPSATRVPGSPRWSRWLGGRGGGPGRDRRGPGPARLGRARRRRPARPLASLRAGRGPIRGRPTGRPASGSCEQLDPWFPTHDDRLDRELAEILTALEAPGVDPAHASSCSRRRGRRSSRSTSRCACATCRRGWTPTGDRQLFGWLARAGGQARGDHVRRSTWARSGATLVEPLSPGDRARPRRPDPRATGGGPLRRA